MAGLLTSLFTGAPLAAASPNAVDDYWYTPVGNVSQTGVRITEDVAMSIDAVYGCVDKLSKAFAIAPCHVNRTKPNDAAGHPQGVERLTDHWLYRLVHDQANERQSAPEFWSQVRACLALRGIFVARKIFGRGDEITALEPLHPDRTEVTVLRNRRRGFMYQRDDGTKEPLTQDEVFCVIGLSLDGGKTGVSVLKYATETLGLARASEDYAARTFSQGALHRGVVEHPGQLKGPAIANLKQSIIEQTVGPTKWHAPLILEEGAKWHEMTMTPEDVQLILSRRFSVAQICRWFDVPLVMVHETDRTTSWGSGIEQLMLAFVTWGVLPHARFIEAAIYRDLVPDREKPTVRAKFLLDALLRADTETRFAAYGVAIQNGVLSENEARVKEDLDPVPGLWEPRRSENQDRGGDPNGPRPGRAPSRRPAVDDDGEDARARALATSNAQRLVRKETAVLRDQAARRSGEGWTRWVTEFYGGHVAALTESLCLSEAAARKYCAEHCDALLSLDTRGGIDILETWEREAPAALVALALGGRA